jgi:GDPmannose 4,6-dehydratase
LKGYEYLKKVIITGSQGQDGILLRQLLEAQGIEVIGFSRPGPIPDNTVLRFAKNQDFRVDLGNFEICLNIVGSLEPDAIFHLAAEHAPSHIMKTSDWDAKRELVHKTHVLMTENFARSILETNHKCRLIVAGSSRMYSAEGSNLRVNETTVTKPVDFYGASKVAAWEVLRDYRQKHGLALKMATLFNHESKLRKSGYLFSDLAAQIRIYISGDQDFILVRDPDFKGDWHAAKDTVSGLQIMAENISVEDLVLASGDSISVREIIESYFEIYHSKITPTIKVTGNPRDSANRHELIGDPSLAESLGWVRTHSIIDVLHEIVSDVRHFS